MVKLVLQSLGDPNCFFSGQSAWQILLKDLQKKTGLGYASEEDYLEVVYLMVECRADMDLDIGPPHSYPLHLLLSQFAVSCYAQFNQLIQMAVKRGGDLRQKNVAKIYSFRSNKKTTTTQSFRLS
jgi:hypothetical protein